MKIRYRIFIGIVLFLSLLSAFYCAIFCYVYSKSVPGWLHGGIIGLFLDFFILSISIPLVKTTVKTLLKKHWIFKPLILIDYCYFILNYFF
jgi:hypothetical protein